MARISIQNWGGPVDTAGSPCWGHHVGGAHPETGGGGHVTFMSKKKVKVP